MYSRPMTIGPSAAWDELTVTLAGPVAERRYLFGPLARFGLVDGCATDYRHARQYAEFVGRAQGKPVEKLLAGAEARVVRLFEHRSIWRAVEHIAAELVERGSLSGFEIKALFQAAHLAAA
jgi:hypothetical protein